MNRCRHTLNRLIIMTASLLGLSGLETGCDKDHGDGPMCMYGCPEYFKHNKELLFYERQKEIIAQLDSMELE